MVEAVNAGCGPGDTAAALRHEWHALLDEGERRKRAGELAGVARWVRKKARAV